MIRPMSGPMVAWADADVRELEKRSRAEPLVALRDLLAVVDILGEDRVAELCRYRMERDLLRSALVKARRIVAEPDMIGS